MQIIVGIIVAVLSIIVSALSTLIIREKDDGLGEIEIRWKSKEINYIIVFLTLFSSLFFSFLIMKENEGLSVIIPILILMSVFDFKFKLVPDTLQVVLAVIVLILTFILDINIFPNIFIAVITFMSLILVSVVTNGGFGGADTKLFTILAYLFGYKVIFIFALTFIIGTPFVLITYLFTQKKEIPLIPYITLSTIFTIMYGEPIIEWYLYSVLYL